MAFLSYAQNFEDVMLWRALGHITKGVYIDIGAQDPVIDSVSKAFYEHGWRGVHIEPVPEFAAVIRVDRPDETVMQIALGEREGTIELNVFPDTGLSTAISAYAERHQSERGYETRSIQVPMLTMRSALQYLNGTDIHWLKIDVEGFERQVLEGWDSEKLRPWIVVVEATIPNSPQLDYESWDPILIAARYEFVYFDGLNRFYIATEHAELRDAFSRPPNVFDAVELSGMSSWGLCRVVKENSATQIHQAAAEAELMRAERDLLVTEGARSVVRVERLEEALAAQAHELQALATDNTLNLARVRELEQLLAQRERDYQTYMNLQRELDFSEQLEKFVAQQATRQNVEREYRIAVGRIDELAQSAHHWWLTATAFDKQVEEMRAHIRALHQSRSWRITAPLRSAIEVARRSTSLPARALRWAWRHAGNGPSLPQGPQVQSTHAVSLPAYAKPDTAAVLTPRESAIYRDLEKALQKIGS